MSMIEMIAAVALVLKSGGSTEKIAEIASDETIRILAQLGLVDFAAAEDGTIYTDENGAIYYL